MIVQCPLGLKLLRASLGDAEGVAVCQAVAYIIVTAIVGVPELQHGCGKNQLDITNVHIVTPSVFDNIVLSDIFREVQKVEREDHALLPREACVHAADKVI